jgi:hypothetical protein
MTKDWQEYSSNKAGYITWERKLLSRVDMPLQVHHTRVPSTEKTFMLHFEDPKTLFFPNNGMGKNSCKPSSVDIEKLFSRENRHTFTHIAESAVELNQYCLREFGTKLDIEISPITLRFKGKAAIKTTHPSVVFNNSINQSLKNFKDRGGLILLNSLPKLYKRHPNLQVTILGAIPSVEDLQHLGLTDAALNVMKKINFYPNFCSERLIDLILQRSWIYVLPSLNLHTDSIFRALENECHIITSSPHGLQNLLKQHSKSVIHLASMPTKIQYNQFGFAYNCEISFAENSTAAEKELFESISNYIENRPIPNNYEIYQENKAKSANEDFHSKLMEANAHKGFRDVTVRDWASEITPLPIFDLGEKKIFRWREIYFIDNNSSEPKSIRNFADKPSRLLNHKKKLQYFGYISILNFMISRFIKIFRIKNYELISRELESLDGKQSWELIKKRLRSDN